jgi:hypothetical protein
VNKIKNILKQFREVEIEADLSSLTDDVKAALPFIRNAMDRITDIFLKQQDEKLPDHYKQVMMTNDEMKIKFYKFFKGPYNQLENFKSEFSEIKDRRKGCAFYPDSLEDSEIIEKINNLKNGDRNKAKDNFTIIREKNGELLIIPYHVYYAEELKKVSEELKKAANLIQHKNLKKFLINRADSLTGGNYRESDSEWVKLTDSPIDLVIGPYEVYADSLFGIKAAYEGMLMIVDHEKCRALKEIENNLDSLSSLFPLPEESKAAVGGAAPILVVNQIYSAGDASQGIIPAAFNLPNDAWVRGNAGWKQVMLYNVMKAKFKNATELIASRIISGGEDIQFEPFFTFVLLHEISHGLGPAYRKNGIEVSKSLGSHYSAVEETKADTGALYLMLKAGGKYGIEKHDINILMKTYLSSLFRSVRFGIHEAHGISNIIQFNWFTEKGNIISDKGIFSIKENNILESTEELLNRICYLEAAASAEEIKTFVDLYGNPSEELIKAVESLSDLPIDIKPVFPEF